ncbi:MAG: hypothetical protein MMC23_002491 [Stictis urceolatum]|nr:hypothetical protein [Stictis urceolata]
MRSEIFTSFVLGASLAATRPLNQRTPFTKREVPQEHSHQPFVAAVKDALKINNPDGIVDSVFGLLGNGAAVQGLGNLKDPDCLQQETADRAFTNAKAAADVPAMTAALVYRALERNTGSVGLKSDSCSTAATNPEIAAISQHQDPASAGAAATNKQIVIALAQQIASVGRNPNDALKSGTFAPGKVGDPTGAGNTCDDANDAAGCIFSQNLLVEDASASEIAAAVSSAGASAANSTSATSNSTVSAA